jgi:hypothetical protein
MPVVLISVEAACIGNAIILDSLASEVALEDPVIGSTDPNISIDNNWTDEQLHFRLPSGSGDYQNAGNESDDRDAITTGSRR